MIPILLSNKQGINSKEWDFFSDFWVVFLLTLLSYTSYTQVVEKKDTFLVGLSLALMMLPEDKVGLLYFIGIREILQSFKLEGEI